MKINFGKSTQDSLPLTFQGAKHKAPSTTSLVNPENDSFKMRADSAPTILEGHDGDDY